MRPAPLVALAAALLALAGCSGSGRSESVTSPTPSAGEVAPSPGGASEPRAAIEPGTPLGRLTVAVFFPAAEDEGLLAEMREIFETRAPGDRAKQIVAELLSGPATDQTLDPLPSGTRLRQVYFAPDGVAYIDLSEELVQGVRGGSLAELLSVYAIVNSVALNIPEIRSVALLIEGQPIETLNGHVDLSRPLYPDRAWILGTVSAGLARGTPAPTLAATVPGVP